MCKNLWGFETRKQHNRGDECLKMASICVSQFQDRLKEQGVSGVTLKWREQPDGKVFHREGKEEKKKKREKTEL